MRLGRQVVRAAVIAFAIVLVGPVYEFITGAAKDEIVEQVNRALAFWGGDRALRWMSQNVLPAYVAAVLTVLTILLLWDKAHARLFGLVDIQLAKTDGSKQLYGNSLIVSTDGAPAARMPAYFVIQPWFVNISQEPAEDVAAVADFWGPRSIQKGRHCRWAVAPTRDAATETTFETTRSKTTIDAGGLIPSKLNVALRWHGESVAYVFDKANQNAYPDWRHPSYALEPGTLLVRLRLAGKKARETFWMRLQNETEHDPRLSPIRSIIGRIWLFARLALLRLMQRAHAMFGRE